MGGVDSCRKSYKFGDSWVGNYCAGRVELAKYEVREVGFFVETSGLGVS